MYLIINKWVIAVKVSNFSGQYLRNYWTLDIGVLGYIGIVWPKEHPPEVWSVPPVTPCIYIYIHITNFLYCNNLICVLIWLKVTSPVQVLFKKICYFLIQIGSLPRTVWCLSSIGRLLLGSQNMARPCNLRLSAWIRIIQKIFWLSFMLESI